MTNERPYCFGYVRPCPTCQDEEYQRERLSWWYWNHEADEYEWGEVFSDQQIDRVNLSHVHGIRRRFPKHYMTVRRGCQEMQKSLQPGDVLLATRLGVLCNDITDALEGLPSYLNRDIRVVLTEDDIEMTTEQLKLLRAVQRGWLTLPSKAISKTVPMGVRQDDPRRYAPAVKELEFMRWCYHKLVLNRDELQRDVLKEARKTLHPRTGRRPNLDQLLAAANTYHDTLAMVILKRDLPTWAQQARDKGFFHEHIDGIAEARAKKRLG